MNKQEDDIFIKDEGEFATVTLVSEKAQEKGKEDNIEKTFSIDPKDTYKILTWAISHNMSVDSEVSMIIPDKSHLLKPRRLWEKLGNIPVNADGEIEEKFLDFEVGEDRETIWAWFEEEFDLSVAKDLMKSN